MKRGLFDITKKLFRQQKKVLLKPLDLSDDNYFVYYASGELVTNILQEIENYDAKKFIKITINTQTIPNNHFLVESSNGNTKIKFIKSLISYSLNENDVVEFIGQIE